MEINGVSLGIDIATSLAVLASAITFLLNQRKLEAENNLRKLDDSVRAAAAEQLQLYMGKLSNKFISEIFHPLNFAANVMRSSEVDHEVYLDVIKTFNSVRDSICRFRDETFALRYQIYPLLDTLTNGQDEIKAFRNTLDQLFERVNFVVRSASPLVELMEGVFSFASGRTDEELSHEEKLKLLEMCLMIMGDKDYRYWVDEYIDEGQEEKYWDFSNDKNVDVRGLAVARVMSLLTSEPDKLRSQIVTCTYFEFQEAQVACKKFLVMLAAINHTLLCNPNSKESPSATAERYAGKDYFAVEEEKS